MTLNNYGFTSQEGKYLQVKYREDAEINLELWIIGIVVVGIIAGLLYLIVPNVGHAESVSPRKAYPATNRGACELLHDHVMPGQVGKERQITKLCAKEGIQI